MYTHTHIHTQIVLKVLAKRLQQNKIENVNIISKSDIDCDLAKQDHHNKAFVCKMV